MGAGPRGEGGSGLYIPVSYTTRPIFSYIHTLYVYAIAPSIYKASGGIGVLSLSEMCTQVAYKVHEISIKATLTPWDRANLINNIIVSASHTVPYSTPNPRNVQNELQKSCPNGVFVRKSSVCYTKITDRGSIKDFVNKVMHMHCQSINLRIRAFLPVFCQ